MAAGGGRVAGYSRRRAEEEMREVYGVCRTALGVLCVGWAALGGMRWAVGAEEAKVVPRSHPSPHPIHGP